MEHILNGLNKSEVIRSLANIINTTPDKIEEFVESQHYRVQSEGISWTYDNLELDHILSHFAITLGDIQMDGVTVSHVAAIMDKESFLQHGLMSLYALFSTDNPVTSFLKEHGITFETQTGRSLRILVNGQPMSTDYLDVRLSKDRCINGFLFGDDPEDDRNISQLKECPEIIGHIGRELLHTSSLREEWISRSIPSIITFKANIEEIDTSTFYDEFKATIEMRRGFFLLKAFERLLFMGTGYLGDNPMVYLKENVNISADRILQIREIER